jgi:arylsulfatase A-like enzyme/tetratricopeptide (TPR) repeat protein
MTAWVRRELGRRKRKADAGPGGRGASTRRPEAGAKVVEALSRAGSRGRIVMIAAATLLATALAAFVGWARLPRSLRREAGQDVLLITIDTLRADALGCYGNGTVETPWIDRLADGGVRFEQAHAQNVVTLPSHANILSGRYPLDHGVRDNSGFRFPNGVDTLATLLKQAGYRTGAFVSAFPLDSRFGLDRGFDVYDDRLGDPEARTAFLMPERSGARTVAQALKWRAAQGTARTFTWIHLYEPHFPYVPPEPFASRYAQSPYHGEVAYADSLLGPVLEPLLRAGKEGHTLVVLTSDHGEGLGEHGEKTHGIFAYETTLHVPLILYAPRLFGPRTSGERVRHIDILPTVLDALGLEVPKDASGRSLLTLAAGGREAPAPSYFEALSSSVNRGWAPLTGVGHARFKLIDLPIPELYDLEADPHETANLAAAEPRVLETMGAKLAGLRAADHGIARSEESAEARERLRSLGYVSATAPRKARYTPDDDPKRLIGLDAAIQEVVTLYQAGHLEAALARVRAVLEQRPDMPLASEHLAFLQKEAGDLDGAVATLRHSIAQNPEDTDTAALLGAYLNLAGRAREAAQVLAVYADRKDPDLDVLMARGAALAQSGRTEDAIATFNRALLIDPSNAEAKANLGTVSLGVNDYPRARAILEESLALDPDVSRAHNALGVIAAETGHPDDAIAHWKRAVELNPREWDTLFNLGKLLRRQGREAEARPYIERFIEKAPPAQYAADIQKLRASLPH